MILEGAGPIAPWDLKENEGGGERKDNKLRGTLQHQWIVKFLNSIERTPTRSAGTATVREVELAYSREFQNQPCAALLSDLVLAGVLEEGVNDGVVFVRVKKTETLAASLARSTKTIAQVEEERDREFGDVPIESGSGKSLTTETASVEPKGAGPAGGKPPIHPSESGTGRPPRGR